MEIENIYRKYFHEVFRYICALSGDESLAEEIAQETFLKAMKNVGKFDERTQIRAWLFAVARNTYFRYCKRKKIYMDGEFPDTLPDPSPQVLDCLIEKETIKNIADSAAHLPEPYKEIFRLRIYGELPFEKIGKIYGKSAGWARVTFYRAKQMIQKKICREGK